MIFSPDASCLNEASADPNHDSSIDDNVAAHQPGQIFDADDQCYHTFGTSACDNVSDECSFLCTYLTSLFLKPFSTQRI